MGRRAAGVLVMALLAMGRAVAAEPIVTSGEGALDPQRVSRLIQAVEPAIRGYPPQFRDRAHRDAVVASMTQAVGELSKMDFTGQTDVALLTDVAHLLAMGHNLDLGTAARAKSTFEQVLALAPDDRRANFLFGMYLVATQQFHFDSLPYLEKALALGAGDARFPLGILYAERGEQDKSLSTLESYAADYPNDRRVRQVIEAVRAGRLKRQTVEAP